MEMSAVCQMGLVSHQELAKHLPKDFFPERKITGEEFRALLEEIGRTDDVAGCLMAFFRRHNFEVER